MDAMLSNLPRSTAIYEAALEGLARVDAAIYREHPTLPSIHTAQVKYRPERHEVWRHVGDVLRDGWGDCEDLASARVGWLRARGLDERARVKVRRTGPRMSHAVVLRSSGTIEDPSRDLGMGKDAQMRKQRENDGADDGAWEMLGADPSASVDITWTMERSGDGWRGTLRIPLDAGRMLLVSRGAAKKSEAQSAALRAAAKVLDNPAVASLVPGPAKFALSLARSPRARQVAKKVLSFF